METQHSVGERIKNSIDFNTRKIRRELKHDVGLDKEIVVYPDSATIKITHDMAYLYLYFGRDLSVFEHTILSFSSINLQHLYRVLKAYNLEVNNLHTEEGSNYIGFNTTRETCLVTREIIQVVYDLVSEVFVKSVTLVPGSLFVGKTENPRHALKFKKGEQAWDVASLLNNGDFDYHVEFVSGEFDFYAKVFEYNTPDGYKSVAFPDYVEYKKGV